MAGKYVLTSTGPTTYSYFPFSLFDLSGLPFLVTAFIDDHWRHRTVVRAMFRDHWAERHLYFYGERQFAFFCKFNLLRVLISAIKDAVIIVKDHWVCTDS